MHRCHGWGNDAAPNAGRATRGSTALPRSAGAASNNVGEASPREGCAVEGSSLVGADGSVGSTLAARTDAGRVARHGLDELGGAFPTACRGFPGLSLRPLAGGVPRSA